MAIGAAGAAVLGAGLQAGGTMLANGMNQNLSRQQRAWNENMWNRQNQVNLENWNRVEQRNASLYQRNKQDSLAFWKMQNEYNSPQAQMARFKSAGLNPNLIYGQGSSGNSAAVATPQQGNSDAIKSPDVQGYSRAQAESITRGMDAFGDNYRFKQLDAQTDNLKAQQNVINQEALLKAQQTASAALGIKRGKFQHGIDKELRETSVEAAKVNLENVKSSLRTQSLNQDNMQTKNKRDKLEYLIAQDMRNPRLQQAYANIQRTISSTQGENLNNELKKEQLKLRKLGLQDSDAIVWRALVKNWDTVEKAVGKNIAPIYKRLPEWYKALLTPWRF